ncbi:hypothetical protein [Amycolatopsis sp. CA-230715]|uniref:hypothetical protein n=1 Tax=Amycolatopsis sp. CA-230715 TaxID=2745196 RepID=UPI001C03689D|nr:hypothetical protein [Amycolatopsis sp. CA-230715]QWF85829.1 hypothetical protein HUW46_09309 [Amycolatopsis sp. CA-230715]
MVDSPQRHAIRSLAGAISIARAARRADLVPALEQAGTIPAITVARDERVLREGIRPDTQEVTIERWELPGRPLWLFTRALVDRGEGSVWEDLVLTEYDLSDPAISRAVARVTGFDAFDGVTAVPPGEFDKEWGCQQFAGPPWPRRS